MWKIRAILAPDLPEQEGPTAFEAIEDDGSFEDQMAANLYADAFSRAYPNIQFEAYHEPVADEPADENYYVMVGIKVGKSGKKSLRKFVPCGDYFSRSEADTAAQIIKDWNPRVKVRVARRDVSGVFVDVDA